MKQTSGRAAVEASRDIRAMQEVAAVPAPSPLGAGQAVVVQGRRLGEQPGGTWIDDEFDPDQDAVVSIKFASDAYFRFLRLYPDARVFARLGNAVTFFFNGRFVQVGEEGAEAMTEAALRKLFG